jgi:hypothetical protein
MNSHEEKTRFGKKWDSWSKSEITVQSQMKNNVHIIDNFSSAPSFLIDANQTPQERSYDIKQAVFDVKPLIGNHDTFRMLPSQSA